MNPIFKYNNKGKHSTKDLKDEYTGNKFSSLDVYLDEKVPSFRIQFLNIFKDLSVVVWTGLSAMISL